jgi:hypothetical protein
MEMEQKVCHRKNLYIVKCLRITRSSREQEM